MAVNILISLTLECDTRQWTSDSFSTTDLPNGVLAFFLNIAHRDWNFKRIDQRYKGRIRKDKILSKKEIKQTSRLYRAFVYEWQI